jgi:hypothetical protein
MGGGLVRYAGWTRRGVWHVRAASRSIVV